MSSISIDVNVNQPPGGSSSGGVPPSPGGTASPPGGSPTPPGPGGGSSSPSLPSTPIPPKPPGPSPGAGAGASSATGAGGSASAAGGAASTAGGTAAGGGGAAAAAGGAAAILGPLAIAGGAVIAAFTGTVIAAKAVDDALTDIARTARKYNPEVAVATAMANVQAMFADMEQANRLGPELASYVTERAEIATILKKIETDIAEDILPLAIDLARGVSAILTWMKEVYKQFISPVIQWFNKQGGWNQALILNMFGLPGQLAAILKAANLIAGNTAPKTPGAAFFKDYEKFIDPLQQASPLVPQGAPGIPPIGKP